MSKCISSYSSDFPCGHPESSGANAVLTQAMAPVYRLLNSLLVITVFLLVALWLSGNGTNAGAFDFARMLVPDEVRQVVWQSGFGMSEEAKEEGVSAPADSDIASVIYNKAPMSEKAGLGMTGSQSVALLVPSVAQTRVRPISVLADRIPASKIDPQALDSKLMVSLQSQRAVADFFEKKYKLDRAKIDEYVSNTVLIAKEVKIDPVLLLAVISVESNFNPLTKSQAGAEGLMQVMTSIHKEKYALYGGTADAIKPEVNIRIGAYILKYLIATNGSLRNGLKYYVGAGNADNDGGYADKVMAERNRLITLCQEALSKKGPERTALTVSAKNVRT